MQSSSQIRVSLGKDEVKPHIFPKAVVRSSGFRITANDVPLDVISHRVADYVSFEAEGDVMIQIRVIGLHGKAVVRPLRLGIEASVCEGCISFKMQAPQYIQVEIEGMPLLYLYAHPVETESPSGPNVRRFESGKIHDAGMIVLHDEEVCWIEAGAVVKGSICASNASGVRIGGYGVLDGSYWPEHEGCIKKMIVLDHCKDVQIENILLLGPCFWMVVLGACEDIVVSGIREIADDMSSDGIDIVGSRNVRVTGCCLHNGDDNIAIKATTNRSEVDNGTQNDDWIGTVENVVVSQCLFYNCNGGSAMEIGYETTTDLIQNIRFEDIDVLAVHQFGSVFGIHNGDRAHVQNILWDDIRVEHHFDTLIDFRVLNSRWNVDSQRGKVSNVVLKNIKALQSCYNVGYTISIVSGYDKQHLVSGVRFENFVLGGRHILDSDALDLVTRNADGILFS